MSRGKTVSRFRGVWASVSIMNTEEGLPVPSIRLLLLLPLVLAAVLLPGSAHSAAKGIALSATVGPGFTMRIGPRTIDATFP